MIRAYRLILSPLVGRDCIFEETCSRHAERLVRAQGWNAGWRAAERRLSDCGGSYSIGMSSSGSIEYVAQSGRRYPVERLSADRRAAFAQVREAALTRSSAQLD